MKRRFTSEELYILRNDIPIDILIEKELMIPTREDLEVFRFACPLCSEFNTSMLREKNLVRCFDCNKNFNTIEIVMEYKKKSFVESVKHLKRYHKTFLEKKICSQAEGERLPAVKMPEQNIPEASSKNTGLSLRNIGYRPRMEGCKNPVRIGEILSTILPDQSSNPNPVYTEADWIASHIDLTEKVLELETKFDSILNKLERIENIIQSK
jgi:hypothetical protein